MADFLSRQRVSLHDGTNEFGYTFTSSLFVQMANASGTVLDIGEGGRLGTLCYGANASGTAQALLIDAGKLQVDIVSGGGGVQYADGAGFTSTALGNVALGYNESTAAFEMLRLDTTGRLITAHSYQGGASAGSAYGVPIMAADESAALATLQCTNTDFCLKVTNARSEYQDGSEATTGAAYGQIVAGVDGSNNAQFLLTDTNGRLQVDIVSGAGGYQYQDGATASSASGNMILGSDGTNLQSVLVNTAGALIITATNLNIRGLTASTDTVAISDGNDTLAIDGAGNAGVSLNTVTVAAVPISANLNTNTAANPIYVQQVFGVATSEIHNYNTASAVAKNTTSTHTFTVSVGKTLLLKRVVASASGAMKIEIKTGAAGNETTTAVAFSSGANPTAQIDFIPAKEITTGQNVLVIRRNDDSQAMDVYSTIMGDEV